MQSMLPPGTSDLCLLPPRLQPYWTLNGVDDGFKDPKGRSLVKARDVLTRNMIINGYNGVW
jgi:hypothetical protein